MSIAVGATKQALANAYCALGAWNSMHTADPGSTGTSEATGGSPAYARKQTVWATGANGVKAGSLVTIDVPAGTYTHVGLWTASTAGTFIDKASIGSVVVSAQGQVDVTPTYTQS